MEKKKEHMNSPPPPARHPSNFFSPQFRDLIDIREGQSERDIQEGPNMEGRREYVNVDTTTCEL